MKARIVPNILFLFICLCTLASSIVAQTQFSNYTEKPANLEDLAKIAERFAEKLASEPSTTWGFITISGNSDEGKKIKAVLSKTLEIKNRIEFFEKQPGVRYPELPSGIEFWIRPESTFTPYTPLCALCECAQIKVSGIDLADNKTSLLTFTANVSGGSQSNVKYKWAVSAGEIIKEQGTPVIKVDPQGANEVKATVEIEGVCYECPTKASFTTKIQ